MTSVLHLLKQKLGYNINQYQLKKLNGKHKNRDILIVGAGPALNKNLHKYDLSKYVVIGLNFSVAKVRLDYFISSYELQHALTINLSQKLHQNNPVCLLTYRHNEVANRVFPHELNVIQAPFHVPKRNIFLDSDIPKDLNDYSPYLATRRNQMFLAFGLAHILGARNIFTIGIEQNNKAHFFHYCEKSKAILLDALQIIKQRNISLSHDYASVENLTDIVSSDRITAENSPFYELDHQILLESLLAILNTRGVKCYTFDQKSIVQNSGGQLL